MLFASVSAALLGELGSNGLEGRRVQLSPLRDWLVDWLCCSLILLLPLIKYRALAEERVLGFLGRNEGLGFQIELILDGWVALAVEGGRAAVLVGGQLVEEVVEDLHLDLLLGLSVGVLKWLLDFLSLTVLFLVDVAVAGEDLLLRIQVVELLHELLEV